MTLDWRKARALCTKAEYALVSTTRPTFLRGMTPRLVRLKVSRARGLRDKFRDLADRQAREAKGRLPPRGRHPYRGNARTSEKAELFDEVLRRLEARAAELEAKAAALETKAAAPSRARAAAHKPAPRPAAPTRRARARRAKAPTATAVASARRQAMDARKDTKLQGSHVPRLHGHVSSRNKRNQARRDARR
jgi:hypothetical protein